MTCNRFVRINQYFHVKDREKTEGSDQLYKVREIMDILLDTFMNSYTLSREVAVDEIMMKYSAA